MSGLSREPAKPGDAKEAIAEIMGASDRAAAILGAAWIERTLYFVLQTHFVLHSEEGTERLFFRSEAPLTSFSNRARIAMALGVFGTGTLRLITLIRAIRNSFAHTTNPLKFDHPLVARECAKLPNFEAGLHQDSAKLSPGRRRYIAACTMLNTQLMTYMSERPHFLDEKRRDRPELFEIFERSA